ncbi:MAG: YraN family protein [Clostridiales bacterium]|nr:YraN family protein [Clostridiales bacterium]
MPDSSQDLRNKVLGRKGEKAAVKYLKKHGYKILETNYVTPFGEADIVAYKDGWYCFVEVKTRASDIYGLPAEAVTNSKRQRYRQIAKYFCSVHREELPCRFDIASIYEGGLEYFEDAYI